MGESGFIKWFDKNHGKTISPVKWCYDVGGSIKPPNTPPKGVTWLIQTYDTHQHHPIDLSIDSDGVVGPRVG
jgi:hypothetical protein